MAPGEPLGCDGCGMPIVGPRLQCLHCESAVELCVGCVAKAAHGKTMRLTDGRMHPPQHVFRRVRQVPLDNEAAIAIDQPPVYLDLVGGPSRAPGVVDLIGRRSHGLEPAEVPGERSQRKRPMTEASGAAEGDPIVLDGEGAHQTTGHGRAGKRVLRDAAGSAADAAIEVDAGPVFVLDDDDDDDDLQMAIRASLREADSIVLD